MRTVVIVDDHAMWRAGVRAELVGHVQVLAESADVDSAVAAVREHRPDVVLLDVHLPGEDGLDVAAHLPAAGPPLVVLVSSRDADEFGSRLRASGRPFIPKARLSARSLREALAA